MIINLYFFSIFFTPLISPSVFMPTWIVPKWLGGLVVFTGLMLMNGAFLVQFWDVDNTNDWSSMFEMVGDSGREFNEHIAFNAFVLTFHLHSTIFIVLEIIGLSLFLFPSLIIFWKSSLLEKSGGGDWLLGFMGVIFWHLAFFALRSMNSNSRRSLIIAGSGGKQHVTFDMHEIENAWIVYMVTVSIALLLILGSILRQDKMFDLKLFGEKSTRKWKLWTLKSMACVATVLCGISVMVGVYTQNFMTSSWLMASGMGLGIGIFIAYTITRILNDRNKMKKKDEEVEPLNPKVNEPQKEVK